MKKLLYIIIPITFTAAFLISVLPANAATETISYLYEDCAGKPTPCYTSMSAWESAKNRDLITLDEQETLKIDGAWTNPDTTAVTIDGWTTDAAH